MKTMIKLAIFTTAALAIMPAAHAATYEEELAQLRAAYAAADKNGDGKLTKKEAQDARMTRIANNFSRLDTDGDGFISLAQLEARLAQRHGK